MKQQRPFTYLVLALICLICYSFNSNDPDLDFPNRPYKVKRYLWKYRYLSVELNQAMNIPIPIILAIAGLESDWGTSELAQNANNHFGIKTKNNWEESYCKTTKEYWGYFGGATQQCFRKYKLIRESYNDFGTFLTQKWPYRQLLQYESWDYPSWAYGLQQCNYATDPFYAQKLIRIIEEYRLDEVN
ncbi:MAG: glucosaminidase domain-containing protein [Saprospiraceae bacterium]|nr:glucosaminidase domain-containing protein [Lewinella sp.]